ncbi:MAG: WecB/TagA/CpsF family glycosyltransferase [Armatimonadetes bacterium]|nr:WecB/TagA/CpsF family glycosyltransferase [Armatimonadota bacterium]
MTTQQAHKEVPTQTLLGVRVSLLDMDGTVQEIDRMVAEGGTHTVVTADASGFAIAAEDSELRSVYESCDLATPDSQGVVWALRRKGAGTVRRVSGVDLMDRICRLSSERGHRLYFLGAAPGVAEMAAEKQRLRHPGCNIVGTRHGYFPADDDLVVAAEVAASKPDILFVAMGIPRQEKFITKTREVIGAKVAMGVGGSFDVFSGRTKRAPKLVIALKLEWLWRLILNPSKFEKVKMLPRFVSLVLREPR